MGISIAAFGIIGAVIGAKIAIKMDVELLKKFFGYFLLAITIYEIYSLIKLNRKGKKTDNK